MSKLREVALKHTVPKEAGIEVSWLFPFLNLLLTQSFAVRGIENDSRYDPFEWVCEEYNTKKLVLERAALNWRTMTRLLALFPNLESLHYQHVDLSPLGNRQIFMANKFLEAIQPLKPCLKELKLLYYCWPPFTSNDGNYEMVSLSDFLSTQVNRY